MGKRSRRQVEEQESESVNALGHVGEFIAARVFGIGLYSACACTRRDAQHSDGEFVDGPLAGKTVNVKWYLRFDPE